MINQILDKEALPIQDEPIQKYRIGAILLEWIPISLILIGFLTQNFEVLIYSSLALALIYILGGWYIFKGSKYRISNIVLVTLTAICAFFPLIVSILYKVMSWPGADEMFLITMYLSPIFTVIYVIWYFSHRQDVLEFRFSLKLLSRIFLLVVLQFILLKI